MDEEKARYFSLRENRSSVVSINTDRNGSRVCHPLMCRLDETATLDHSTPAAMTEVGFNCLAIAILTAFRPNFVIFISVIPRIKPVTSDIRNLRESALLACYIWFSIVMFVLCVIGIIPIFADKIKKRWILLIHPWALLVTYVDVLFWLIVATTLYIDLDRISPAGRNLIYNVKHTEVFFILMYLDILAYFIVYYIFFSYYIAAELTIIEEFY